MIRHAILITNPVNVRYLSGFATPSTAFEAALLQLDKRTILLTHAMNAIPAAKIGKTHPGYEVRIMSSMYELPRIIRDVLISADIAVLETEPMHMTHDAFEALRTGVGSTIRLVETQGSVDETRKIKTGQELSEIRHACKITDECYAHITGYLKPGVSEGDIAWEIESYFRSRGASCAFAPIAAFGANSAVPHHESAGSTDVLGKNDCVLLDFGASYEGYASDMTRCIALGRAPEGWKQAYDTVLRAQNAALSYLGSHAVASGADADARAHTITVDAGYPRYPHSLGHNLGLEIHESPRLSVKKDADIIPGMTFTVEPGVYLENRFGIRIEDTVLKTTSGIEILTTSAK